MGCGMPVQRLIICRIPSVLEIPSALHFARNAAHSSSSPISQQPVQLHLADY
jgi:hypothetical protein